MSRPPTRRRAARRLVGLLAGVAILLVAGFFLSGPLLRSMGRWLIVSEPLAPADAIVVVAGGTPGREREAAELFKRGLAPRVIVSRPSMTGGHVALMRFGIRAHTFQEEARLALEKFGVPSEAIVSLTELVPITEAEMRVVHQTAAAAGYRRVILVTSPDHTRRVRMIWTRLPSNGVHAAVHASTRSGFSADDWWRRRRTFEVVMHEYLGIGAIALGVSSWLE
jgi:uncharacterized SAM-binding protein YcdF (DUF218 family)